ncbi:MAG: glycosyl hydrolase, partial [Kiritimatiellaeota bacterium]|nr:glycosyl hydrolase [Kiritimatiellota bacterium]
MHKRLVFTAAFAAIGATFNVAAQNETPEPFSKEPPLKITSPWAICSGAEWSGEFPRFNPMLKDAGVRSIRLFNEWQGINPRQGVWNYDTTDKMAADARKNNMELIGLWCYFSPWTSADGGTRKGPVKDMQYWRDFVRNTTARYKNDIRWWGVWNEFNGSFYNTDGNKVKEYTDLLVAAYDEVKKIDKNINVGIDVANFDVGFINSVIQAGGAGKFDYIQVHPYENLGMVM